MADQEKKRREINVGFGQTRAVEPEAPRQAPLGVRLLRGDFQARRPAPAGQQPVINVGMGTPTAEVQKPPQGASVGNVAPVPAVAAPQPAPATPAAAAPAPRPSFSAGTTVAPPRRGDMNTFTGANGVTRRIDPAPASAAAVAPAAQTAQVTAPASNAAAVQQSVVRALDSQRGLTRTTRADAAEVLNPMSADAEILRRLENSQNSYFNKGSPQARRLIGEAIAGQLGARNAASAQGQRAGNDTLERGVGYEAGALEGAARRQLDADTFNVDAGYRERALAAEQQRPTGTVIRGLDGNTSMLRNDGSVTTLRDEAGKPIQTPEPAVAGALTPAALLESYSAQAQAINEGLGTPEEKAQQQAALRADPIYGSLFGQQGGGKQVKRTGTLNGRKVVEYSDGSVAYQE